MWIAGNGSGSGTWIKVALKESLPYSIPAEYWTTGGQLVGDAVLLDPGTAMRVKLEYDGDLLIGAYINASGSVNLTGTGKTHYGPIGGGTGSLEVDIYSGRAALYLPNSADMWSVPVPEPTTVIIDAFLLLPLLLQGSRSLRAGKQTR